jgi:hypothetical protein
MRLTAGDWVEVRSKEEILRTLDKQAQLDGLPFMPQMFRYCGQRFKVFKRAHKTCDTVSINPDYRGRRLPEGIHLDLRCNGQDYAGCQAACLIFWKEQWLKRASGPVEHTEFPTAAGAKRHNGPAENGCCTEADVDKATRAPRLKPGGETVYVCQATRLPEYTKPLPWWDARQYLEDYTSGNASLWQIARGLIYVCYYYPTLSFSRRFGAPARWLYDRFQSLWGGPLFPRHRGRLPPGQPSPVISLNLQPGELVRVKSYEDILHTLDTENMNLGMRFDGEEVPFCGRTYRVRNRVERFIDEKTGKIRTLKTPAFILEGVYCQGRYSSHRMFCPRSIFSWWREVWLERVSEETHRIIDAQDPADKPKRSGWQKPDTVTCPQGSAAPASANARGQWRTKCSSACRLATGTQFGGQDATARLSRRLSTAGSQGKNNPH